ncbi:MAG: helix-turn-helix domain-containing protein [Prevotella sp.]|nr:helix-turn-helix domain-containing protein [Prevotella sp.]
MKPRFAIFIFGLLLASALLCSMGSYRQAQQLIVSDMSQALEQTLETKSDPWITPDTIRDYRSHLQIAALRSRSFVAYDMPFGGLRSDAIRHRAGGSETTFRSYASCSPLMVLSVSDQRFPALLWMLTLLWGALAAYRLHRQKALMPELPHVGTLSYDAQNDQFLDAQRHPIHLTPMQTQLLRLFFDADGQRLSKQTICDALWPKKPDASETLYTLIRRLKPIVEQNSDLHIVSDRGKAYELTTRESAE